MLVYEVCSRVGDDPSSIISSWVVLAVSCSLVVVIAVILGAVVEVHG